MFESGRASPWLWSTDAAQGEFAAAYARFRVALEEAWPSAEAERLVADAFAVYAAAVQRALDDPERYRHAVQAYGQLTARLRDAFATDGARDKVQRAYRAYVDDLQRAWTHVDPSAMTAEALGTIAHSIGWIGATVGLLDRAFATSEHPTGAPMDGGAAPGAG